MLTRTQIITLKTALYLAARQLGIPIPVGFRVWLRTAGRLAPVAFVGPQCRELIRRFRAHQGIPGTGEFDGAVQAALAGWIPKPPPPPFAEQFVAAAEHDLGATETPAGSNSGPRIDAMLTLAHVPLSLPAEQKPWCAAAVSTWAFLAGYKQFVSAGVAAWEAAARNDAYGLTSVSKLLARRGDAIAFGNGEHIGLITAVVVPGLVWRTVEGNTSPDSAGSQSNGGMVCRKTRYASWASTIIRFPS